MRGDTAEIVDRLYTRSWGWMMAGLVLLILLSIWVWGYREGCSDGWADGVTWGEASARGAGGEPDGQAE